MNRRGFIKSSASAIAASGCLSWLITPEPRRTINLSTFCDTEEGFKYDMQKPFEQDDWTYATDSRICVRVRPQSGDVRDSEISLPPASKLPWWDRDDLRGWQPISKGVIVREEWDYCEMCLAGTCGECENVRVPMRVVEFGGKFFWGRLWDKMKTLGEVDAIVGPLDVGPAKDSYSPLVFRFDGGMGLISPLLDDPFKGKP